jgi:hypothetical protein
VALRAKVSEEQTREIAAFGVHAIALTKDSDAPASVIKEIFIANELCYRRNQTVKDRDKA